MITCLQRHWNNSLQWQHLKSTHVFSFTFTNFLNPPTFPTHLDWLEVLINAHMAQFLHVSLCFALEAMSPFILSQCSSWQSTSMGPLDSNKTFKSVTYSSSKHSPMLWTLCKPNHNQHTPNSHLAYLWFHSSMHGVGH